MNTLKRMMSPVLLVLGGGIVINAVIASVMSNLSTGTFLTYALGILLLLCGFFWRSLPRWVRLLPGIVTLTAAVLITLLFVHGHTDTITDTEDVVVVLGAGIQGDKPTKSLQNRLDRAVQYHRDNPDALIIVSGGQGPQETITEALAMERYLIEQGVPASCILKEEVATSTTENFLFAKPLIDARFGEDCRVAFITTDYHIYRAALSAAHVEFQNVTHAHSGTPWYMIVPNGLRECLSIGKFWIFP